MSKVTEELEINLLNLAKLAIENGHHKLFKQYRLNHVHNKRKEFEREKATTVMVAIESTDELWDLSWDLD